MRRAEGWDVRLTLWADARRGNPFAWGETDCAILAFEAIDVMSGADPDHGLAARYRRRYASRSAALRLQRHEDADAAKVLEQAGCVDVRLGFQQRGDVLIYPARGFACAYVCLGSVVITAHPDHGVRLRRTAEIVSAASRVLHLPMVA